MLSAIDVKTTSCKLAVLKLSWNPRLFIIFLIALQNQKVCFIDRWPFIFPLIASAWSLLCVFFKEVLGISSAATPSLMLSNCDSKSPSLLAKISK